MFKIGMPCGIFGDPLEKRQSVADNTLIFFSPAAHAACTPPTAKARIQEIRAHAHWHRPLAVSITDIRIDCSGGIGKIFEQIRCNMKS